MALNFETKASGASFNFHFLKDTVSGDDLNSAVLVDETLNPYHALKAGESAQVQFGGGLLNPTSILTRPSSAVSSAVTCTSASPMVVTWSGNPLVNNQTIIFGGTTVPLGTTAGLVYYVMNQSGNTFNVSLTRGGTLINSTSTGTAVTATVVNTSNSLIASNKLAGSITVPNFSVAAGGGVFPNIMLRTNAATGWLGTTLSVNFWSAAPTYSNGDVDQYVPATGVATWLANYLVGLNLQCGDGTAGRGPITNSNPAALKFAGNPQTVYWDLMVSSGNVFPAANQTFTVTADIYS